MQTKINMPNKACLSIFLHKYMHSCAVNCIQSSKFNLPWKSIIEGIAAGVNFLAVFRR